MDINEIRITGTVERYNKYTSGKPMIRLLVNVWRERVPVIAFGDLAARGFSEGSRIEARGFIQSTAYTAKDGAKRYGWQIVARELAPI